jgi:hypothetical protein
VQYIHPKALHELLRTPCRKAYAVVYASVIDQAVDPTEPLLGERYRPPALIRISQFCFKKLATASVLLQLFSKLPYIVRKPANYSNLRALVQASTRDSGTDSRPSTGYQKDLVVESKFHISSRETDLDQISEPLLIVVATQRTVFTAVVGYSLKRLIFQ